MAPSPIAPYNPIIPSFTSDLASTAETRAVKIRAWANEHFSHIVTGMAYGCASFAATILVVGLVHLITPVCAAIDIALFLTTAGSVDYLWGLPQPESIQNVLQSFFSEEYVETLLKEDPALAEWLAKLFLFGTSNWNENFLAPFKEEFLCRVLLQGSLKRCFRYLLPSDEMYKICGVELPLSTWISVLVTSVIFGMLHDHGGVGLMLGATLAGGVYGILKERFGFMAGWAAHSFDNTLCSIL